LEQLYVIITLIVHTFNFMPYQKIDNFTNAQLDSREFLKGSTGDNYLNYNTSNSGLRTVAWTIQAGTGNPDNMRFGSVALSNYRESEINAFKTAFKDLENISNLKFLYTGINNPEPVDMVVRILKDGSSAPGQTGAMANTRVNWENRYLDYDPADANKYYTEIRLNDPPSADYETRTDSYRDLNYAKGSYGYSVILHEVAHGLSIKHMDESPTQGHLFPGVAPGTKNTAPGRYGLNNQVSTVQSYREFNVQNERTGYASPPLTPSGSETDNGLTGDARRILSSQGNLGFAKTMMAFDVAIIQALYGMDKTYRGGDDIYILPSRSTPGFGWECIWDTGGTDTMAASRSSGQVQIDLRNANLLDNSTAAAGFYSYDLTNTPTGGFTIANDWDGITFGGDIEGINVQRNVIENAKGGLRADRIIGNKLNNQINGYDGNDNISAGRGNDTVYGDNGDDTINGGDGNDVLVGGAGSDIIDGGDGNDLIIGAGPTTQFGAGVYGSDDRTNSDGRAEVDRLTGGAGSDTFSLIANGRAAYNDMNARTAGSDNYALIMDFTLGDDKLLLIGSKDQYRITRGDRVELPGATIIYQSLVHLVGPPGSTNELIAKVNSSSWLDLNRPYFEFRPGNPAPV